MYRIFKAQIADRIKVKAIAGGDNPEPSVIRRCTVDKPFVDQRQTNHEEDGRDHDINDTGGNDQRNLGQELHIPVRFARSMSRDSFSTFTTAAETPSHAGSSLRSSVIIVGDLSMPTEIYICGTPEKEQQQEAECDKCLRKSGHYLPKPPFLQAFEFEAAAQEKDSSKRTKKKGTYLPQPTYPNNKSEDEDDPIFIDDEEEEEIRFARRQSTLFPTSLRVHPSKSDYYDTRMESQRTRQRSHSNGDIDYLEAPARWTRFEI